MESYKNLQNLSIIGGNRNQTHASEQNAEEYETERKPKRHMWSLKICRRYLKKKYGICRVLWLKMYDICVYFDRLTAEALDIITTKLTKWQNLTLIIYIDEITDINKYESLKSVFILMDDLFPMLI